MEKKTYDAKWGKVQTGDYVVCVTNKSSCSALIDVGKVYNDGYVYIRKNRIAGVDKILRRKIGSIGCPVCKLDDSLISDEDKQNADEAINEYYSKRNTPHTFKVTLHYKTTSEGKVLHEMRVETSTTINTLPENPSEEEIRERIIKNLKRRWEFTRYKYTHGYEIGDTVTIHITIEGQSEVKTASCDVSFEEV